MKSLVLATMGLALGATATLAADLPSRRAPPVYVPPALPAFSWTGFEAGLHSAYTFGSNNSVRTTGRGSLIGRPAYLGTYKDGSSYVGAGVGYNYQFTPGSGFVVGVEASWTWTDLTRGRSFVSGLNDVSTYRQSLDWLGTVTGRVGYAFDRFLVYGTGGFAYGNVFYDAQFRSNNAAAGFPLAYAGRYDDLETGYVYGGGVEWAIPTDSFLNFFSVGRYLGLKADVTLKAEYLRYDLGSRNVLVSSINPATGGQFVPTANGSYTSRFNTEGQLIRAGFNYKFGSY